MKSLRCILLAVLMSLSCLLIESASFAQPTNSRVTVGSVEIWGVRSFSSVTDRRTPEFNVQLLSGGPQVITLVSLVSIGPSGELRQHPIQSARQITVTPGDIQTIEPVFRGDPLMAQARGLPWHRFRLTVSINGRQVTVESESGYMCRIPRHP